MTSSVLLFLLGLMMIVLGGDSFVGYAVSLAKRLRLPPAVVGATVVSVGTTLPEIIVSVTAAVNASPQIAIGNALGSIICNSALIGGLGALLRPSKGIGRRDLLGRLCFFLLAACFISLSVSKTEGLGIGAGIILLSIFAIYALTSGGKNRSQEQESAGERPELICVGLIVGAAALYLGSRLLVDNGALLAHALGVPQQIIALTFISLGTSLPELVTTVAAVIKKQSAMGLGNVIGANILNLVLVLGLPAVIAPLRAEPDFFRHLFAACAAMLALTVPPVFTGKTYRWQGALLLACYGAYCVMNFRKL